MYNPTTSCPTSAASYTYTNGTSMNQTTQTYNGQYICLYGADAVGNYSTQVSSATIHVDITAPTFTFANANGNECETGTLAITSATDALI